METHGSAYRRAYQRLQRLYQQLAVPIESLNSAYRTALQSL